MKKWILKAIVQKSISYLPYSDKINFLFQKYVTKGVELNDEHFQYKVLAAGDHVRYYQKYGGADHQNAKVLELGTGWYPIVPTILWLNDFEKVVSIDITGWMNAERQITAFKKIIDYHDRGLLTTYVDYANQEKLDVLRSICNSQRIFTIDELNEIINLEYFIMDATQLSFEDQSFDFICSNNTFEHIYKDILYDILQEFRRVLKDNGLMSHFIDLSDHFSHFDSTINIYNFLQFSRRQWDKIDNTIQPQNRLRWRDYQSMYAELGIAIKEEKYREGSVELLKTINIHDEFSGYSNEELAISHGYIIS